MSTMVVIWLRRVALALVLLVCMAVASLLIYQRLSDGPTGPLMGSTFTSGELVSAPIKDWAALEGDFEFELVAQGSSRTAGGVLMDGQLYITCDLGFIWARLPSGMQRNILHLIWLFKTWHFDAQQDGRVRIRKDGRIYPVVIQRVQDAETIERLKGELENLAAGFFGGNIGPRPTEAPNDIWFFLVRSPNA